MRDALALRHVVRGVILDRQQFGEQLLFRIGSSQEIDQLEARCRSTPRFISRPRTVDRPVIVGLRLFISTFFRQHPRHREIRCSVRRIPLQQRQQHLLGRARPPGGERRLSECDAVRGILAIERGSGAEMLDCLVDFSLRGQSLAGCELTRGVHLSTPGVYSRQCRVEQKQSGYRGKDQRERCYELGGSRSWRRGRRLNEWRPHKSG